jgi:hypothetical protein
MTKRYLGNIITQNPTAPAGPYETSAASGVWSLAEAFAYSKAGLWPTAGNPEPDAFQFALIHDSNSVGPEGVYSGLQSTYFDNSNNINFVGYSSSTAIFDYQGMAFVKIPYDLSGITYQRNLDTTGSNDTAHTIYQAGSQSLGIGYGFYYANSPNSNSNWFMMINAVSGSVTIKRPWTYSSYYTSSEQKFVGVNGSNTYILFGDYNSGSTSGNNIRLATLSSLASNNITFTGGYYFGGTNNNGTSVRGVTMDSSGIYVTGNSAEMGQAQDRGFVCKISYAGSMQWIKSYGTASQNNYGQQFITTDSSNNVYSAYKARKNGNWEPVVQKHNTSGTLLWEVTWAVNGDISAGYIDSNGDLYLQGYRSGKTLIVKMDPSDGSIIWQNWIQAKSGASNTVNFVNPQAGAEMRDDPTDSTKIFTTVNANDTGALINSVGYGFITGINKDGSSNSSVGTLIEYVPASETFSAYTSGTGNTSLGGGGTFTNTVGADYTGSDITTSTTEFDFVNMNEQ